MSEPFFKPWVGPGYESERLLLLSESCYDWFDEEGDVYTPQTTHPEESIDWNIHHFGKNRYFTQVNRALYGKHSPTSAEMRSEWDRLAYSVYVQQSVGQAPGVRPTNLHWDDAKSAFLETLERLRPLKVIVTGTDTWNNMPDCPVWLVPDLQAYKLADGQLVWCLAIPHPANRQVGFNPTKMSQSIRAFRASRFPSAESEFLEPAS